MSDPEIARRPLTTRDSRLAQAAAAWLAARGVKPNVISVVSVFFAALGGGCLLLAARADGWALAGLLVGAGAGIQCRLLCNLFDGMVAIEGGFQTKSGEIFNDFPDRLADVMLLVPAGYASAALSLNGWALGPILGWLAGCGALMTAYTRMLGGACGLKQRFSGPMAKQHRMAVLTFALLIAAVLAGTVGTDAAFGVLQLALAVIVLGCVATTWRRVAAIVRELEARP